MQEPILPTPPTIHLTITVDALGRVNVNGAFPDKLTGLGLLEMAKQVIINFQPAPGNIIPAHPAGLSVH